MVALSGKWRSDAIPAGAVVVIGVLVGSDEVTVLKRPIFRRCCCCSRLIFVERSSLSRGKLAANCGGRRMVTLCVECTKRFDATKFTCLAEVKT
jgi:hypothetical protein